MKAPIVDIDLEAFSVDPYPTLKNLRREAPVAYVPQLDGILLTRHHDITTCLEDPEAFSSRSSKAPMERLMGHNFMREDGVAHADQRRIVLASIGPRQAMDRWTERFQAQADSLLDMSAPAGGMDLVRDFALPFTSGCLRSMLGLLGVEAATINDWSVAMIDAFASPLPIPEKEKLCDEATAGIDAAIDDMAPILTRSPDDSLLSVMLASGLPMDQVRANLKLVISGGQNEPRDVIAGTTWALLNHPNQLRLLQSGKTPWVQAMNEFMRWVTPIGLIPRLVARATTLGGVDLDVGDRLFLMLRSGNRDEARFDRPDEFDIERDTKASLAFSAGPHFCVGSWAAKAMIADVALPTMFRRLDALRLADMTASFSGFGFRTLPRLSVAWGRPDADPEPRRSSYSQSSGLCPKMPVA